ncbi:MAG: hypothetical protein L0J86_07645 [Corynebacterium sp.]|nr:hypothetical protein [Corynebacterium sp.]
MTVDTWRVVSSTTRSARPPTCRPTMDQLFRFAVEHGTDGDRDAALLQGRSPGIPG